jgi:hypothetical protein
MQDKTQERAEQMQDKTAAAIAWLESDEGRKALEKWPVWCEYGVLRPEAWRLNGPNDHAWNKLVISPAAAALVEHAWRVELEGRILAVRGELVISCPSYDARNPYVIRLYTNRRHTVAAPTLVEALAKAREATA